MKNEVLHLDIGDVKAKKGYTYLAVTDDKKLYVIKQTGARSWGACNMDARAYVLDVENITGNSTNIMGRVNEALNVNYVVRMDALNKIKYRKCVMEFNLAGTIGETEFIAEIKKDKRGYAVYKGDGTPWTEEELKKVCYIAGDDSAGGEAHDVEYIYDDGASTVFMHCWAEQDIEGLTKITYEEFIK